MNQNTYVQNILYYFSQLDWDRLYFYLKDEYSYQDTTKEIFLSKIKKNFDKHIENANFFVAYNKKKSELEQLLFDWEVVQEEIDSL